MLAAFLAIALYAGLAGATPSVVRAAIMGGLSVLAVQLGRQQNGLNTLAFMAPIPRRWRVGGGYIAAHRSEWMIELSTNRTDQERHLCKVVIHAQVFIVYQSMLRLAETGTRCGLFRHRHF